MTKIFKPTLRQIEDWHYNYILRKNQEAPAILFTSKIENFELNQFEIAYSELFKAHDSLRTYFPLIKGEIMQVVRPYSPDFDKPQIVHINEVNRQEFISSWLHLTLKAIRNLKNGYLTRGLLLCSDIGEFHLYLAIHHIVVDYWSLSIIRKDFFDFYNKKRSLKKIDNVNRGLQLHDFSVKQNEGQNIHEDVIKYWTTKLEAKDWHIKYDEIYEHLLQHNVTIDDILGTKRNLRPKKLIRNPIGESYQVTLDAEIVNLIYNVNRDTRASMFSILCASFSLLAYSITHNKSIVIQSHFFNRLEENTRNIVGNLIGKVLMVCEYENVRVIDFVMGMYANFIEAIPNIILNSERLTSIDLTTKSFLFLSYRSKEIGVDESIVETKPIRKRKQHAESPLVCHVSEYSNTIAFHWFYNLEYFNFPAIQYLVGRHMEVLKLMLLNLTSEVSLIIKNLK